MSCQAKFFLRTKLLERIPYSTNLFLVKYIISVTESLISEKLLKYSYTIYKKVFDTINHNTFLRKETAFPGSRFKRFKG